MHQRKEMRIAYRLWVPGNVEDILGDSCNKVEDKDDQHDERADEAPRDLPEDVRLVANHEHKVIIEPAQK